MKYENTEQVIVVYPTEVYISYENRDSLKNKIYRCFTNLPLYLYHEKRIYNYKIPKNHTLRSYNFNVLSNTLQKIHKGTIIRIKDNGLDMIGPLNSSIYVKEYIENHIYHSSIPSYDYKLKTMYAYGLYSRLYNNTYFSNIRYNIYINRIYLHIANTYSYFLSPVEDESSTYMRVSIIKPVSYFTSYNLYDILSHIKKYSCDYYMMHEYFTDIIFI